MINREFHKSKKDIQSEIEEIESAKKDSRKFEVLYNRYHEQIFRYLYARVDNKHLASDLTSQVFYKAMLNIENYTFKGVPFASWLYRIAFNEMNMYFRKEAKIRTVNIETEASCPSGKVMNVEIVIGLITIPKLRFNNYFR